MILFAKNAFERNSILESLIGDFHRTSTTETEETYVSDKGDFTRYYTDEYVEGVVYGGIRFAIYIEADPMKKAEILAKESTEFKISKYIRYGDLETAKDIINDYFDRDNLWETMKDAAEFYTESRNRDDAVILKCEPEIAYYDAKASDGLCKSNVEFDRNLDIYVSMSVYSKSPQFAGGKSGEFGFYLSDFYSLTGDNAEILRRKAYLSWELR